MNKKIVKKLCAIGLISSIVLSGCGKAGITGGSIDESAGGTDKVVSLKVWTEKDGLGVMNKMIDSFKEQYKDEAEFDITVEIQADSQFVMSCLQMYTMVQMCFHFQMIRLYH